MSGFIFRGIHSSRFGVLRNPSPNEKGGDMEEYTLSSQELDGSDGGYWSDTRVPARSKDLSCYFEDITAAQREGLLNWLSRKQSGS